MPRVLLAPDKFKGTLTAAEVAGTWRTGIRSRRPDVEIVTVPVADGGRRDARRLRGGRLSPGAGRGGRRRPAPLGRRRYRPPWRRTPSSSSPPWPGWPSSAGAGPADRDQPGRRRGDRGRARRRLPPDRARDRRQRVDRRRARDGAGAWARGCPTRRATTSARAGWARRRPLSSTCGAASGAGRGDGRGRLRRRQPADRSARRRGDVRPAEGRRPGAGAAARRGARPAGPTSSPRPPARIAATSPGRARPAASASLRSPFSARRCGPASRSGARPRRVSPTRWPAPTSSSPARARSTSRRCAARRRRASRPPRGRAGSRWSPSPAGARSTRATLRARRIRRRVHARSTRQRIPDESFTDAGRLLARASGPASPNAWSEPAYDGTTGCSEPGGPSSTTSSAASVVGVTDGRIAPVEPRSTPTSTPLTSSSSAPTRCCCPAWSTRTCTSTSPVAPSGRASTPPPGPPRPAASRRSSTCRSTASRRRRRLAALEVKRERARRQAHVDVGFWGGAVPGNLAELRAAARGRRVRVQVLPRSTPASKSSRRWTARGFAAAMAETARSARCSSCTPRTPAVIVAAPPAARRGLRAASCGLAPGRGRGPRDRPRARRRRRRPAAGCTSCTSRPRRRAAQLRAARQAGVDVTVETCPHYLSFDAAADPRRRDPVQVLPADPRRGPTRTGCGPALADGDIDMVVSDHSPCTGRAQAPGHRRLRAGVGRDRLGAARAWPSSGPRPERGAHARRRRRVGWPAARPTGSGWPTRAGSRSAPTPTWSSSPPTRSSSSTRGACCTEPGVAPTPGDA